MKAVKQHLKPSTFDFIDHFMFLKVICEFNAIPIAQYLQLFKIKWPIHSQPSDAVEIGPVQFK